MKKPEEYLLPLNLKKLMKPTKKNWMDWAQAGNIVNVIIRFLKKHRVYLNTESDIKPTMRAWARISDILKHNPNLIYDNSFEELCVDILGKEATEKFIEYVQEKRRK